MFFPRATAVADPFWVRTPDGAALACHRAAPHGDAPTVIHFHGNGEVVADYVPTFANLMVGLGVNVIFAEYRGYGASSGRPSLSAVLDDAEAVLRAARQPPDRVIAYGRSMGSYAAIELASRHPLAGLVIESGIADPLERVLLRVTPDELEVAAPALAAEVEQLLDHQRKLERHRAPILVLHAVRDEIVDASHAVRLASWAASEDRELVLLPRGGHNDVLGQNHAAYLKSLSAFFLRCDAVRRRRVVGGSEL
jgi:pimeloyl-ACP methyl ester carboxylesterase